VDENVRREYETLLAQIAVRQGALLRPANDRGYGWIDPEWEHLSRCGVRSWGRATETTFQQFEGTFFEGERIHHAVDVADVTCHCGEITGREVRWEPSNGLSDVAEAVFAALYEKTRSERSEDE